MNKYLIALAVFMVFMFLSWGCAYLTVHHTELSAWYFMFSALFGILSVVFPAGVIDNN